MDMDISMDIHAKICVYGYGYGWEISYPRQACCFPKLFNFRLDPKQKPLAIARAGKIFTDRTPFPSPNNNVCNKL